MHWRSPAVTMWLKCLEISTTTTSACISTCRTVTWCPPSTAFSLVTSLDTSLSIDAECWASCSSGPDVLTLQCWFVIHVSSMSINIRERLSAWNITLIQWNLDTTVTLGSVLTGCYTLGDMLMRSDPIMYWDHLGLSLLIGIDQKSGLYRWPLTQVPL